MKLNYTYENMVYEIKYRNFDLTKLPPNFRNKKFIIDVIKNHKVDISFFAVKELHILIDCEIMITFYHAYTSLYCLVVNERDFMYCFFHALAPKIEIEKAIVTLELMK